MKKHSSLLSFLTILCFILISCEQPVDTINNSDTGNNLAKKVRGTTLQEGVLLYSAGHYLEGTPIPVGFDIFGYNYQGHLFKGSYANVYLGAAGFPPYEGDDESYLAENPTAANHWAWPYRETDLLMKWNDAWLSNRDCDGDGKLDRHYGYDSYIGSGAWETNQMKGTDEEGTWTYFTKIVAVPEDAVKVDGIWYGADGIEIGPDIWGQFAIILEVANGEGAYYISPSGPGFGKY